VANYYSLYDYEKLCIEHAALSKLNYTAEVREQLRAIEDRQNDAERELRYNPETSAQYRRLFIKYGGIM
jgi:hypothetical protein